MTINITKALIGAEDVNWDDGGAETSTPFSRTTSTGGNQNLEKVNASHVPMLDAPWVSGGRAPFDELADAAKDVEECVQTIRRKQPEHYNFKACGGTPNSGGSVAIGVAQTNTAVWEAILDDINSKGGGGIIFFPSGTFEFALNSGLGGDYANYILPWTSTQMTNNDGLLIYGTPNTTLKIHSSSGIANLLHLDACSNIYIQDLQFDRNGKAVYEVALVDTANSFFNIHLKNVRTNGEIIFDSSTAGGSNRLWLTECIFGDNVTVGDWQNVYVLHNVWTSGNYIQTASASLTNSNITVFNNKGVTDINFLGGASASLHKDIVIENNRVDGTIDVRSYSEVKVTRNQIFSGAISFTCSAAATDNYVLDNVVDATGRDSGIYITTSADMTDVQVCRNQVANADKHGIHMESTSTAVYKRGAIADNILVACNVSDTADSFIYLSAASGHHESYQIHDNQCIETDGTKVNLQNYGIETNGGSGWTRNYVYNNLIKGYSGGAILDNADTNLTAPTYTSNLVDANFDGGATT